MSRAAKFPRLIMVRVDEAMFKEIGLAADAAGANRSEMLRRAWRTVKVLYSGIPLWESLQPIEKLERLAELRVVRKQVTKPTEGKREP